MKKKIMSVLLAAVMVFALLPTAVWAEDGIPYLDWDNSQKKLVEKKCASATKVESGITAWESGWYVVSESVTISDRITVTGEVNLILEDGCSLTANDGIDVAKDNSLTIYGQSGQTGELSATTSTNNYAGIGSSSSGYSVAGVSGTITINGGNITAKGGSEGAGIGGGYLGAGGTTTINGGTVVATGGYHGAGIGGSERAGGTITINGGSVTARGGAYGAGIGGGMSGEGGDITITGGTVKAAGGTGAAGIGGGGNGGTITITAGTVTATGGNGGAGIGGGSRYSGGIITINGGNVTATGGVDGAGIGGGSSGDGGTIEINGGIVTATGSYGGAGIGGGSSGDGGSFSTGAGSNAVIDASSISDLNQQSSWSGIIFDGKTGEIYDTPIPEYDFEIPFGKTLNVKNVQTLDITEGVTMTNKGTVNLGDAENLLTGIFNSGTIINKGTIHVWGNIAGREIKNQNGGEIIYHFNLEVTPPTFAKVKYGYSRPEAQSITITSIDGVPAKIISVEIEGEDFALNAGEKAELTNGTSDTSWAIQPKAGLSIGTHTSTITVTYSGSHGAPNKTATAIVTFTVGNWADGSGTADDPYLIPDLATLEAFRDYINSGKGSGEYFKLTADIDMPEKYGADSGTSWTPIGTDTKPFQGTFDGGGCTISGLYINTAYSNQGLFGYSSGTIKNLTVSGSVTGKSYVGSIAGVNSGNIENCHNEVTVSAGGSIGGIAGINYGSIENCYNTGTVSGNQEWVGGIAGYSSGSVNNCYNTGDVKGTSDIGGIVGLNDDGSINNCYYLDICCETNYIGTSKTAEEFNSGEVAWLLQNGQETQAWGQKLGDGADVYPVLTSDTSKKVLKVTFATQDNSNYAAKYTNLNGTVTLPSEPTKENYTFAKWSLSEDAAGEKFDASTSVTKDMTVYAVGREHFGGDSADITLSETYGYNTPFTVNLDEYMKYANKAIPSEGKFTYSVTDQGGTGASISENTLTVPTGLGAGEYTITVTAHEKEPQYSLMSVEGYGTEDVTLTVKVRIGRATATVTAPTGNTLTYNGKAQALITGGSVKSDVTGCGEMQYSLTGGEDYDAAIPTGEDARTYTVYWKVEGANTANYNYVGDTSGQVTVTIGKSDSDVTGGSVTITYGENVTLTVNVAPQATAGIALTSAAQDQVEFEFPKGGTQTANVVMSSDGKGTATLTIPATDVKNYLKPGENIVTVSYGGSGNLNEKDSVTMTVTVEPKTLDFTFTANTRVYDQTMSVTGTFELSGVVDGDNVTVSDYTASVESANAGGEKPVTANVTALGGTDAEYYKVGTVDGGTVTISKATISSVTPPTANGRTYDGTEKALVTAPASIEGGTMRYALGDNGDSAPDNSAFKGDIPQAKDAGTYYVWYYVKGDGNHNDSDMDKVAVTIERKPVTLTWSDVEGLTYTGNEQSVTATIPEGVIESGDKGNVTVSVSGGNRVEANPGSTYNATASLSGDRAENYTLTNPSQTYTIHKAASSVAASASDTPTYGESITLTATVSASGVDESLITGTVTFKVGGTMLGTATVENGEAALTIDGTNTGLQKTLFGENGTSTVTAAYGGNANITGGSGETEVTVSPRALTYTVTAADKEYDGETAVIVALTPNNLVGADAVTLTATGALSSANAATYEAVDLSGITKGGADAPYYTVAGSAKGQPIKDGVTITPRVAALAWKLDGGGTFTVDYTGKAHAVTAEVSNKVNSDDVSVTVQVKPDGGTGDGPYDATATDVGAYTATATGLTGGAMDNYTLEDCATTTQAVTIQPVAASATGQPEAKAGLTYSGAAQALVTEGSSETGTVVYALSADAETQPDDGAFTAAVPQGTNAGTYYVWWKVRGDGNHSDTAPQSVSVTIARAPVSFTIGAEAKPAHDWTEEPNADPNLSGYAIAEDADPAVWNDFALTMTYDSLEHRANVLQDSGVAMGGLFSVSYKRVRDAAGDAVTGDDAGIFRDAGTYEIWVTLTGDPQNFMFAGAEPDVRTLCIGAVTVKPYEVRVTWQNVTFVYHGHKMHPTVRVENAFLADEQPDETEKQGFLKDPSSFHEDLMAYAVTDSDGAGSYLVTVALYGGEAGNYTVSNPTATVVIQPAPVVFEVTNNEWLYRMDKGQERDVTLTASWGEVTNAPDTVLGDSYPGAGTKITLNDLGVTDEDIEYRLANGTVVDNPTEIGTYQVWVRIPNANFRHASASGGDFHNVGILRIAANDHPATYTVTFDPGRDERGNRFTGVTVPDPMKDLIPTQEITLPPAPENAPEGYVFAGWSLGGALYQPNEEFYMVYSDVTFVARWTKEIFNISGVVIDDTESPIPYVSVTLMMGEHQMGLTTTDKDGAFRFDGLIPNTYNLVFTWNGVVKTYMVEITDKNVEGGTYTLPGYRLNTVVEVAPGSGSVVVDLDPIITDEEASELYDADERALVEQDGGTVEFMMKVEDSSEAAGMTKKLKDVPVSADNIGMVLDMNLTKSVTKLKSDGTADEPTVTPINDSKVLIANLIYLPADLQGKDGYTVYRFHDDEVQAITTVANKDGERIEIVKDGTAIMVYARYYSTYVLTWYQNPPVVDMGGRVTVAGTPHGAVSPNTPSAVPGGKVTLTVKPDDGYVLDSLTVTDQSGKAVAVTDNGDGTYSFTMPGGDVTVKASFKLKPCDGGTNCPSRRFPDLDPKVWYHEYTDYVITHSLMNGNDLGLFDPDGAVTRAAVVMTLWNYENRPVANYAMRFTDMKEGRWYTEAIRWAASEGIVDGYASGTFQPDKPVNREELAKILYGYEKKYGNGGFKGAWMFPLTFADSAKVGGWAYEAVAWCGMNGVITGKPGSIFDPAGNAKRSDLAAMLTRYFTMEK